MTTRIEKKEAVIADNGKLSTAVGLGSADILGLDIPALISGTLKFKAALTFAGTYKYVKGLTLTDLTVSATTGSFFLGADALSPLRGAQFVKIESSASQTSGPVTFTFVIKRFK